MKARLARSNYVESMAKLTVWIRQRSDHQWEAIDYYGACIAVANTRGEIDMTVRAMARDNRNNIWCIAHVTAPSDRKVLRSKPIRRSL